MAEPPLPSASSLPPRVEAGPQAPRPRRRAPPPPRASARAARRPRAAFISTERAHVLHHRLEVGLALGQERVEEARRAGVVHGRASRPSSRPRWSKNTCTAPRARGRGSRPAPGATNGSSSAARRPTRRPRLANASVRQPRPRAAASARRRPRAPKAITHVVGPGQQLHLAVERAAVAGEPERGQRALADDHRVDELHGDVARVRPRLRASARAPPAGRRARSAPPSGGRAGRSAPPRRAKKRSSASPRSLEQLGARARRVGDAPRSRAPRPPAAATPAASRGTRRRPRRCAALTSIVLDPGVAPASRLSRKRSRSKSRCGSRSILLTTTSSQVRNISGYLSGLSSPSATERHHRARVLADAELGRADEVADVLDHEQVDLVERQLGSAERTMFASRWHSPPKPGSVLSWVTGTCSAGSRSASSVPATSPSSTPDADAVEPLGERALEQRRLAGAGGAHQVDDPHAGAVEVGAVRLRRSWRSRRARPRRPSPWCDACFLLLDLDRLDLELVAGEHLHAARRRPGSGSREVELPLAPAAAQRSRARDQLAARARALADACRARRSRSRTRASPARPGAARRPSSSRPRTRAPRAWRTTVSTIALR